MVFREQRFGDNYYSTHLSYCGIGLGSQVAAQVVSSWIGGKVSWRYSWWIGRIKDGFSNNDSERTEATNPLIYVRIIFWGELVYFVEEQKDVLESRNHLPIHPHVTSTKC